MTAPEPGVQDADTVDAEDSVEPGTLARNRAARRRRVLDAALALAASGGFDAVQMRDVAAEAGVALGTVYRYFDSKERLIIEAFIGEIDALGTALRARPPQGEAAADRVVDVLRRATAALGRYPAATGAMVRAVAAAPSSQAEAVRRINDAMNSIILGAMHPDADGPSGPGGRDAPVAGAGPSGADLAVARILNQVWFSSLVGWVGGVDPAERVAADLEVATRLLVHGD